jgi:hypothetical protein
MTSLNIWDVRMASTLELKVLRYLYDIFKRRYDRYVHSNDSGNDFVNRLPNNFLNGYMLL